MIGLSPFRWRNERKGGLQAVAVALAAAIFLPGCSPAEPSEQRRIIATEWDTLMQLGTDHPADTLFAYPIRVLLWGDGFAVAEQSIPSSHPDVRCRGQPQSGTAGREGGGPREFKNLLDLQVAPNDNLWALDANNARISEIDAGGEFVRQIPPDAPAHPGNAVSRPRRSGGARSEQPRAYPHRGLSRRRADSRDVADSLGRPDRRVAQPLPGPRQTSHERELGGGHAAGARINLFGGDSVGSHAFIEHIPFDDTYQ